MPLRKRHIPWRLVMALALVYPAAAAAQTPPAKSIDFAHADRAAAQGPLRRVPHQRQVQGRRLPRHARGAAQVESRGRPAKAAPASWSSGSRAPIPKCACRPRANRSRPRKSRCCGRGSIRACRGRRASRSRWSTYVAPLKPRRPTLPPARPGLEHPIDRILDAYHARHKITPPVPVDDVALPAPRLSRPDRPVARAGRDRGVPARTPSRQAAAPRPPAARRTTAAYADHWLTFWNDLLRNDYAAAPATSTAAASRSPPGSIARSLDNKPYDHFVRELISPTPESEGFIKGIKWRGNVNASQVRELQFAQNVAQVFFGANLKCASCHDSFIDSWKLADAYGLAAVIADRPLQIHRCDKAQGKFAAPRFLWPELGTIDAKQPKRETPGAARRTGDASGQRPLHANHRQPPLATAARPRHRASGRCDGEPAVVGRHARLPRDLSRRQNAMTSRNCWSTSLTSRAYQAQPALFAKEPAGDDTSSAARSCAGCRRSSSWTRSGC